MKNWGHLGTPPKSYGVFVGGNLPKKIDNRIKMVNAITFSKLVQLTSYLDTSKIYGKETFFEIFGKI